MTRYLIVLIILILTWSTVAVMAYRYLDRWDREIALDSSI